MIGVNKGKQGEGQLATMLGNIQQVEEYFEFIKPTYTNAPDDGLDFEISTPHNIAEKFNAITNNEDVIPRLSNTKIKIRLDHKNYDRKISKPVADKFVKDCEKHLHETEHWLTGGNGLTSGAKKSLENSDYVCRYFPQNDLDKINSYYKAQLIANQKVYSDELLSKRCKSKILIQTKR